jgi:AhpD family alkylhydroperoxidase
MNAAKQILEELRQPARDLPERIPGVFDSYGAISTGVLADGALDAKTKELIALAIAVAKEGDGCITSDGHGAPRAWRDRDRGRRGVGRGHHDERWPRHRARTTGFRRIRTVRHQAVSHPEPVSTEIAQLERRHCDALGRYSGFPPPDPAVVVTAATAPRAEYLPGETFLRGRQITDAAGAVEFRTIYPG